MSDNRPSSFTDRKGRLWHLEFTVDLVRRIKDTKGINLLDHSEQGGLARLYDNPMDLADVLWLCVEEEATAAKIDDMEFGKRLGGDAIDDATAALCQALVNFSPRHQRPALGVVMRKMSQLMEKQTEAVIARLESPEMEAQMEALLKAQISGNSSGK